MTKFKDIIKNIDKPLFILTLILFVLGLVMIFSASNVTSYMNGGSPYAYFFRQGLFLIVSFIFCIIMVKFNTKFYGMMSNILLIAFVAVLILLLIYGKATNYAVSWIPIGPFTLQPSEFIKVIIIVFMARFYEVHEKRLNNFFIALIPLIIGVVITFLIMLQPDFGTGVILVMAIMGMLFVGGVPISFFLKLGTIGVIGIVGLILAAPYRLTRILSFLNPWKDPLGSGFQIIQSLYAIGPGGLFGYGFLNSRQKHFYLPEPQTDFIFSIISEEFGFMGILIVASLFLLIIYRGFTIARNSSELFPKYVAFGITFQIAFQAILNLMVVVGLIPVTGVTLPFLSYGGSSLLISMVSMGILLNVSRNIKS